MAAIILFTNYCKNMPLPLLDLFVWGNQGKKAWKDDAPCVTGSRSTQEEISSGKFFPSENAVHTRALFSSQTKCWSSVGVSNILFIRCDFDIIFEKWTIALVLLYNRVVSHSHSNYPMAKRPKHDTIYENNIFLPIMKQKRCTALSVLPLQTGYL